MTQVLISSFRLILAGTSIWLFSIEVHSVKMELKGKEGRLVDANDRSSLNRLFFKLVLIIGVKNYLSQKKSK